MSEVPRFFAEELYCIAPCALFCPYSEDRPEGGCDAGTVVALEDSGIAFTPDAVLAHIVEPVGRVCMEGAPADLVALVRERAIEVPPDYLTGILDS